MQPVCRVPLDAPAGLEASVIRLAPAIGTTVGLLTVVPTVAGSLRALTPDWIPPAPWLDEPRSRAVTGTPVSEP